MPRTLFDGVLTEMAACQFTLNLRLLKKGLLVLITKPFENFKPEFYKEVLVTGQNLLRHLYFPSTLLRVLDLERV
jgi:hypothetical protein